jgi:hypothetical protein
MEHGMRKRFTALCGLYCLDCIPSHPRLFAMVKELTDLLDELRFEHYAELKSHTSPVFGGYAQFREVLRSIGDLQCVAPCTKGGGKPNCEVRACVTSHALAGCWECAEHSVCELLEPLKAVHPNLEHHLALIREHGPDGWADKRRAHYRWQT